MTAKAARTKKAALAVAGDPAAEVRQSLATWWVAAMSAAEEILTAVGEIREEMRDPTSPLAGLLDAERVTGILGAAELLTTRLSDSGPRVVKLPDALGGLLAARAASTVAKE